MKNCCQNAMRHQNAPWKHSEIGFANQWLTWLFRIFRSARSCRFRYENCLMLVTLKMLLRTNVYVVFLLTWVSWRVFSRNKKKWCSCDVIKGCSFVANKILILNRVGWQCDQITAATWSGTNCQPTITQPFTLIILLFGT